MGKYRGGQRPPAAKRPPLTHFLCLPLVTSASRPQLEVSLRTFKEDVCPGESNVTTRTDVGEEGQTATVHPKAIRPVGALHCTLGVMSLNENQLADAVEYIGGINFRQVLEDCTQRSNSSDEPTTESSGEPSTSSPSDAESTTKPLQIELRGLVSMHEPHKTSILYSAPSEPNNRLLPFCLAIQKLFKDKGFLIEDNRDLKLHATIVNTIYAKSKGRRGHSAGSGHGPNANAPLKIDANAILERYENFVWAENVTLDRVSICEMGAKKIQDANGNVIDEEYTEIASVTLPL